jgi:hypothetical protein
MATNAVPIGVLNESVELEASSLTIDETLSQYIICADARELVNLLADYPDLRQVLDDAPEAIGKVFERHLGLSLDLFVDPEGPSNPQLWIMVRATRWESVDSALERLRALDRDWLVRLPRHMRGLINIDVEFP